MTEREITETERGPAKERVEQELLNGTLNLEREVNRFSAMGEQTRFTILYLLAQEEQMESGELADQLGRHQNDLYHHLNTLEEAGLIGKYRDGQARVYELSPLAENLVNTIFDSIKNRAQAV
ncbi:regulatory protein ArsR [Natronococcus amylolyticus DSM 10524]|uniref:Regulatory protein ArsR n=1 Tax=Natronococcus amylolyticus DSM 10524 TaxID=1227497 RepID=L9X1I2_9EURY|nr:metalloregulator ArsR/SmtB family transcription factor [Natronococcus amylolyticus]ELY55462.1 regulatory protein ArsR [Natronococcus amylolyticus DSM 10524]